MCSTCCTPAFPSCSTIIESQPVIPWLLPKTCVLWPPSSRLLSCVVHRRSHWDVPAHCAALSWTTSWCPRWGGTVGRCSPSRGGSQCAEEGASVPGGNPESLARVTEALWIIEVSTLLLSRNGGVLFWDANEASVLFFCFVLLLSWELQIFASGRNSRGTSFCLFFFFF